MSYQYITNLKPNQIKEKSVLLIGSGYMAEEYANTLSCIGIKNVAIIGNTKNKVQNLCKKFGYIPLDGGYSKNLPRIGPKDLVIIATPIQFLLDATSLALKSGFSNILIEKPAALDSKSLNSLKNNIGSANVRIGYNRLCYPSFHKLVDLVKNDGGITSCHFTFTEWIHKINFTSFPKIVYSRWGISNSLHVISMALKLIGMPKKISCIQTGKLPWHKSGAIFTGSGISKNNIPFSYHSDWHSAGRWGVDVMTRKNSYRLMPLEQLYLCKKGSTKWEKIPLKKSFPKTKEGLSEEIFSMLYINSNIQLTTLKEGEEYIKIAERIFGY